MRPDAGNVNATVTKAWGLAGEGCETITRLDKSEVRDEWGNRNAEPTKSVVIWFCVRFGSRIECVIEARYSVSIDASILGKRLVRWVRFSHEVF